MRTELIEHVLDFYGEEIISVQDENGTVWVPVKRLCENLGLDPKRQISKLQEDTRFSWRHMSLTAKDGKNYMMFCIDLDSLQGWLFTINPNKVRSDLKDTLIKYQTECVKVLNDYWRKGVAVNPRLMTQDQAVIDYTIKQAMAAAREEAMRVDPETKFDRDIARYLGLKKECPQLGNWAESCIMVSNDWYQGNTKPDTSLDPFALSDLFRELGFNQKEALGFAMRFGKVDGVKKFSRGKKRSEVNGNIREVNYYIKQDYNELAEMATQWLAQKNLIQIEE